MAQGINKVILIGYLGNDPELKHTNSGTALCTFPVATSESFTNRNGERVERTEWHNIVAWGRQAETCSEYLEKGRQVYVEGRLRTSSWEDNDGNTKYRTEVNADRVVFLGGPSTRRRSSDSPQAVAQVSEPPIDAYTTVPSTATDVDS